jgi:hypothetical protein
MSTIAAQAARTDRDGCSFEGNLEKLSLAATCQLIKALVP